jgi:prepilin-type N-terminal cleavage/methylation domain-containing protein
MKSQRGFTVLEMMISVGILGLVVVNALGIYISLSRIYEAQRERLDGRIEQSVSFRFISQDLVNASPSLNNINLVDDNGLGFFDYLPDYPAALLTNAQRTRRIVMSDFTQNPLVVTPGAITEIIFATIDVKRMPIIRYDPSRAYQSADNSDPDLDGTFTYSGVNNGNAVTGQNAVMWVAGEMAQLYVPSNLRPVGAPANSMPRFPSFFCTINGTDCNITNPGGVFRFANPLNGNNIGSADEFFRGAPPVAGGTAVVFAAPIRVYRYRRVAGVAPNTYNLARDEWKNGAWQPTPNVANEVRRIIFARPNITVPLITFQVE